MRACYGSSRIRLVLNEQTYPRLFQIAWSTTPDSPSLDERAQYRFGLDCILDGVQAMIDRGGSTRRDRST